MRSKSSRSDSADTDAMSKAFVEERADPSPFLRRTTRIGGCRRRSRSTPHRPTVLLDDQGRIALVHRGGGILDNPQFRAFLARLNR